MRLGPMRRRSLGAYQRKIVSDVTRSASCSKTRRPRTRPSRRGRGAGCPRIAGVDRRSVRAGRGLLLEIRDDVALAPVHPAREDEQQELQRRDRHVSPIIPQRRGISAASMRGGDPQGPILSRDFVDRRVAPGALYSAQRFAAIMQHTKRAPPCRTDDFGRRHR
jgi:hypothetical protein